MARYRLIHRKKSNAVNIVREINLTEHDDIEVIIKRYSYHKKIAASTYDEFDAYIYDSKAGKKMKVDNV